MYDTKSGLTFLQRSGLLPTHSNPEPRIQPCSLLVHTTPLEAPLPPPAAILEVREQGAPDRYVSQQWPHETLDENA